MQKIILNPMQLRELIVANRYKIDEKTKFLSRCIDGRYPNENGLPPLAIPGADGGEMAVIFSSANSFGFEVDEERAYKTLVEIIGGEKNLEFHADCGHMKQMNLNPNDFNIDKEQLDFIKERFKRAKEKGAKEVVLQGEHLKGALVIVKGDFGLLPQYTFSFDEGNIMAQVFVFHQTLVDQRHRALAKKLIENKAVKLYTREFEEEEEDYIYTTLTETAEAHLFEITKKLAKGLPIYHLSFENNGEFEIKDMGKV